MQKIALENSFKFLLICLVACIYYPILTSTQLIDNDYSIVIAPLLNIHSLQDYWLAFQSHRIFDVQPVRDVSILLAQKISAVFGFEKALPLYNLLLWFFSLFLVDRILRKLDFTSWQSLFIVGFLAVHPVLSQTIPWMSAHKHLLAFTFALLCFYSFISVYKNEGHGLRHICLALLFYTLSIFSQPLLISLPIGLTLFAYLSRGDRQWSKVFVYLQSGLFIIMMAGVFINIWYYSVLYVKASGSEKFIEGNLAERLLSLGRYFAQVIFPVSFARNYSQGSVLNLVGLMLMPLFFFISKRLNGSKATLLWGSFFFLPLVMVNIQRTNIFVSDSYLLFPCFAIVVLVVLCFQKMAKLFQLNRIVCLSSYFVLLFLFAIKAHTETLQWVNPMAFVKTAYEREKSCANVLSYATYLWKFPEHRSEALKVTQKFIMMNCQFRSSDSFMIEARNAITASIYFTEEITLENKIDILKESKNPYASLFLIALYIKNNENKKANDLWADIHKSKKVSFMTLRHDPAVDELKRTCLNNRSRPCQQILSSVSSN